MHWSLLEACNLKKKKKNVVRLHPNWMFSLERLANNSCGHTTDVYLGNTEYT